MNKDTEKRIQKLFAGAEVSLSRTDPEFADIIANFRILKWVPANLTGKKLIRF